MQQVVNAGAAAAVVGQFHFYQFNSWNGAQQFARSVADLLPVQQVAGVLAGDAQADFFFGRAQAEGGEEFGHITHLVLELFRSLLCFFIIGEKLIVFF